MEIDSGSSGGNAIADNQRPHRVDAFKKTMVAAEAEDADRINAVALDDVAYYRCRHRGLVSPSEAGVCQSGLGVPLHLYRVREACFWSLRDFGTPLMIRECEQCATGTNTETSEKRPKHKRSLKTLSTAINMYMR